MVRMRIEIWESGKLATGKLRNINAESLEYAFYLDGIPIVSQCTSTTGY